MTAKMWKRAALAAAVLAVLAGCGQKPAANPPAESPGTNQGASQGSNQGGEQSTNPPASKEPQKPANEQEKKEYTVKLYYADAQIEKLVEREKSVSVDQEKDKYLAVLKELATSPDSQMIALCKGFTFHSAELKDKQLNVDLSISPEGRLGSGGEELVLDAIKRTLFQFDEIESFDLLVDGQQVESLMGHMDLPHPIKR